MSPFVNRIVSLALGATVMAVAAASASAQEVQFHLPFQAKWGATVLPPGDYRLSAAERSSGRSSFWVRGPAGTSLILPVTADAYGARSAPPAEDYLQLVKLNGEYFVAKYEQESRAITFFFETPKPNRRRVQISDRDFTKIPVSSD
jgi:hypothetical protein